MTERSPERREAVALGLKRYFTGAPCARGHVAERFTLGRQCVECLKLARQRCYHGDIEESRQKGRAKRARKVQKYREKERLRADGQRERRRAKDRAWRATNPEKAQAHLRNRRARIKQSAGTHNGADVISILAAQRGKCAYCRAKLSAYDVDHIQPLAKGGSNGRRNLQIACPSCNRSKHDRDPVEFAQSMGLLI